MEKDMGKKIQDYLAENLPVSEERIPTSMHPDCEVCVVIPSYGEREYILRPLVSLANQKRVTPDRFEVIVVVNNPGNPPQKAPNQSEEAHKQKLETYRQVVENNRETLRLLKCLTGEDSGQATLQLSAEENEIITRIKQTGLKVYSIDKSSPGKTLPHGQANVGSARNRGTAEAVERFYQHLGKNGIIAHTDADAWMEEYYIENLITAFAKNPKLVGLAGIDADILLDPWDRKAMKDSIIGEAAILYFHLAHQKFIHTTVSDNVPIYFIGSNMAARAFETAMVGGINKVPGGEDYALAKKLNEIGLTGLDMNVITYPAIRYSVRAEGSKGLRMVQCTRAKEEKKEIHVRSIDAAYHLGNIYSALQQARINQNISVENLRKILIFENQPIFNEQELLCFSKNVHQFNTPLVQLLNKELKELVEKLTDTVENKLKPLPITRATSILINFYLLDKTLKKIYESIKEKTIQKRNKDTAALEFILENIFQDKNNPQNYNPQQLEEIITSLLEKNKSTLFSNLLKRRYRLKRAAQLIALARTKQEAMQLLKINFMRYLEEPEPGSELAASFELSVLSKSLNKIDEQHFV